MPKVLTMADGLEPRIARAVARALRAPQARVDLVRLVELLERDQQAALELVAPLERDFADVSAAVREAFMTGFDEAAGSFTDEAAR